MQQQLSPATSGSAPTSQHHHRLYSDTLNSPYYPSSQNPSFNSNYSPVQLPNLDPNSTLHINQYANAYSTGVTTLIQPSIIDPNSGLNINHYAGASIGVSKLVQPTNLDPNPALNTNHYANAVSSQGSHQPGLSHVYIQAAPVQQEPNAIRQQYALNSVKPNQMIVPHPQKRILRKNRPKKIKIVQLFQCEVCNVKCNSESILQLHNEGNKHKKTLQKLGLAEPSVTPAFCEVCNVHVNSNIVLEQHKLGKNHKKNVVKLTAEKSNVSFTWCEVCQVNYSSKIVLDQHKLGKKHKKQVEKLNPVKSSAAVVPAPPLDPVESGDNPGEIISTVEEKTEKKTGGSDDLESKKSKIIECGAAPDAVCMCTVCNVVCNSNEVFKFHLAGKKHIAMMKKRESVIGNSSSSSTTTTSTVTAL